MPRSIRDLAIMIIVIGLSVFLIFSAAKKQETGVLSRVFYSILRPFDQAVLGIQRGAADIWTSYFALVGLKKSNEQLKEEIRNLRREKAALLRKESENVRLKKLLNIRSRSESPSLVAQIIGEDATGWYRTLFVNRGAEDGVAAGMPVVSAEGVVGRVVRSGADMSQVVLITDPGMSLDCRVVRTRDRGILKGALDKGCLLKCLSRESNVEPGDDVVSSGLDGVFPIGVPVGKIKTVRTGEQGLFLEADVTPAAHFSSVEEVLIILASRGGFDIRPGLEDRR